MLALAESLPDNTLKTVAVVCLAAFSGDRNPQTRTAYPALPDIHDNPLPAFSAAVAGNALIIAAAEQPRRFGKAIAQTRVNDLRPWLRRLLMILRPVAVFILLRKPCSDLRRRLLG